QAEDGIRGGHVTGVQTCALPISMDRSRYGSSMILTPFKAAGTDIPGSAARIGPLIVAPRVGAVDPKRLAPMSRLTIQPPATGTQIGRASCRERVWMRRVAATGKE